MNNTDSKETYYPISTVAKLTGVNAITLRAWERRYKLVQPFRKESGHRLYTQQEINRITQIVGLLERGMRIGQIKASLDEVSLAQQHKPIANHWQSHLDSMIAAVIRFEEPALEQTYNSVLALYPTTMVTEKLLVPVLVELGERWANGRGSIAEEHFFAFYLRNKLGARFHHRPHNPGGQKLLMACLPGEIHETGLLVSALAANDLGFQTILLGSDLPLNELPAVAKKTKCAAIVLSGKIKPSRTTLTKGLPNLVSSLDIPVFLGGQISVTELDALDKAGVHTLGTDLLSGLQQIVNKTLSNSELR